jgi:transposase
LITPVRWPSGLSRRKPHGQAPQLLGRVQVQDYLTGETLHGLGKRHDISRNLIRIWIAKHEAGALDSDTAAAGVLTEYDARIAALERLVGKLALENEFLKGVLGHARLPRSASTCVVAGPVASRLPKDAD